MRRHGESGHKGWVYMRAKKKILRREKGRETRIMSDIHLQEKKQWIENDCASWFISELIWD